MLVLNDSGNIFDERRKNKRRVSKPKSVPIKGIDVALDRRKEERRKVNLNATKRTKK